MMAGQVKLNKLIYDAVIKLCCEQLDSEHSSRLEIDGIICIATEEPDNQIVVKIHEKLRNVSINNSSSKNSHRPSDTAARSDENVNHSQGMSGQENGHDQGYAMSNGLDVPVSNNTNQRELSYGNGNETAQDLATSVLDLPGVKDESCRILAENNIHLQNTYGATAFPESIETESRLRLQSETSMRLQSSQFTSGSAIMPSFHTSQTATTTTSSGQSSILGKLLTSSRRNKIRSSILQSQRGRFTKCMMCSAMFRSHNHLRNHLRSGFCGKHRIQTEASRVMNVFAASRHEANEHLQIKASTPNQSPLSTVSETSTREDGHAAATTNGNEPSEKHSREFEAVVKPEPPDNGYEHHHNNNNDNNNHHQPAVNGQSDMSLEGVDMSQHAESLPNSSPIQQNRTSSVLSFPPLDSASPNFHVQSSGTVKSTYEVTLQRAASKFSMSSQLFGTALSRKVRASASQHARSQISPKPNFNERGHFQCSFCAFEVQNWSIFEAHSQREHNRSLCKVCGAAFTFRTNKNRHEKTCAGLVLFTCEICGKNCKRSDALRLHKIKAHPWRFEFTT